MNEQFAIIKVENEQIRADLLRVYGKWQKPAREQGRTTVGVWASAFGFQTTHHSRICSKDTIFSLDMITTQLGYEQSLHWLKEFELVLEDEKRKYLPHKPRHFQMFASGTIAQIEDLKKEIADYEKQHLRKAS